MWDTLYLVHAGDLDFVLLEHGIAEHVARSVFAGKPHGLKFPRKFFSV